MGKKKLEATLQLQRLGALPYNHYFEAEVVKFHKKYAIPEDPHQADDWLDSQLREELGISSKTTQSIRAMLTSPTFHHGNAALTFIEMVALREHPRTLSTKLRKDADWSWNAPLFRDIGNLLERFRLPVQIRYNVLRYISTGKKEWLDLLEPWVKCEIDLTTDIPEFRITVGGFIPWITKKQWLAIWNTYYKTEVSHISQSARKRATTKSLREQMQRWSEWYQLSETHGLGPVQALNRWESEHPDECGKYDLSTVTHAIQEFREIINPLQT